MPRADLSAFATGLAERLPGTWTSDHQPLARYRDQFPAAEDLWDAAHADWAVSQFVLTRHAVLTGPDNQRLYVIDRPLRQREFIVAPLVPAHLDRRHVEAVEEPNGVVVPSDPVRAASAVTRRLLPRYSRAVAAVHRHAAAEQTRAAQPAEVVFAWQPDQTVTAVTDHPYAVEYLQRAGFYRDARAADTFALPPRLSAAQRDDRVRTTALALGAQGAHVTVRAAVGHRSEPAETVELGALVRRAVAAGDLYEVAGVLDEALDAQRALETVVRHSADRTAATGPAALRADFAASFGDITTRLQQLTVDLADLRLAVGEIAVLTHVHGEHIWTDLLAQDQHPAIRDIPAATTAVPAPPAPAATTSAGRPAHGR